MDLNELASFIRVAELGTITAAAAAEGVPKSTISRRIARLEDELGVALLRRAARSFTLTGTKTRQCAHCPGLRRQYGSTGQGLSAA